MVVGIIIAVVVVLLILFVIVTYNGLVRTRNRIDNAFSPDRRAAQAPARPDPEPGRDGEGLRRPREGRVRVGHPGPRQRDQRAERVPRDQAQAENQLSGALKSLFAVAEAYPDLKANQNFLSLQEEILN